MSAARDFAANLWLVWTSKSPSSSAYSKIYADDYTAPLPSPGFRTRKSSRWLPRWSLKTLPLIVAPVVLFSCLLFTVSYEQTSPVKYSNNETSLPSRLMVEKGGTRRLRVLAPADEPSPNLCRMLISALVSGYPSPVILNWGHDFHKSPGWFGDSHLGKIGGALEFLDAITSDRAPEDERLDADDLVLVVDAYDLWFQLPPSLLIRRYMAQNHASNQRIRKEWGVDLTSWFSAISNNNKNKTEFIPRQSIIISTQKKCWPDPTLGADLHCDELPESPARKDLYGPHTDEDPEQYHDVRPRYVNSGSFMGPVSDMRRLLRRAQEKVEEKRAAGIGIFSDQGIFAEMFGEQEMWRTSKRQDRASGKTGPSQMAEMELEADRFDYGIGLDYVQDLFTPTVFEEDDGEYVVLSNETALRKAAEDRVIIPP